MALKSVTKYPVLEENATYSFSLTNGSQRQKRTIVFKLPIRLVRRGEAGESSEDSWVLVAHRAPAGWDIDPRMAAHLADPPNGWLLMHVHV